MAAAIFACAGFTVPALGQENAQQVASWNRFARHALELQRAMLSRRAVREEESTGGYGGVLGAPDFYREIRYYDASSGLALGWIQWERDDPANLHAISVPIHDGRERLLREYGAAYLARYRNAPIQTVVNFFHHGEGFTAYRQFDASGRLIYEQCRGERDGVALALSHEDFEIVPEVTATAAYRDCFGILPTTAGPHLDPLTELTAEPEPADAAAFLERADARFTARDYEGAVADYGRVIALDPATDAAYYGRGMALGRLGRPAAAVADLDIYIERHPDSALAHVKRGVRHLWMGDDARAERDFRHALTLAPDSAEAHDDLGVVLARRGEYAAAIERFETTIRLEPGYQKAHHNLALVYHLLGRARDAMAAVDAALGLDPHSRSSTLLKSRIVRAAGREREASALEAAAARLVPGGSENVPIR